MPTFDANSAAQWRSWQPEDLLNETVEVPLQTQDTGHSDAQFKAELARLREQAEQQGIAQGLAQGKEEGRREGYEAGLKEGREAGLAQGLEQARDERQALLLQAGEWVTQCKLALSNLDSLIPGRLVQLALTAVQQLYGTLSVADNHALLAQIRQLMKQDTLLNGPTELHVNPQDLPMVSQAIGETLSSMGWSLQSDPQLAAGGCRVVTPDVEYDATMETRWQSLCQLAREELSQ
ncbi:flagellar assembly protein FliH [Enterobacter hormaechei]|uniref:flagellar assembly protein FliH n=1 Tax=Enterobacter hormaechei TaxID=158836 RepID=UPI00293B4A89|nr:flagellar assembly protein FliH [Enterobacter hormaechei]EKS6414423.1 flagellar assembly protein FliH [Enterobacter hormaechei]ELR0645313.1 flagellar assembly protein FliH [Enterobacter hormaechei]